MPCVRKIQRAEHRKQMTEDKGRTFYAFCHLTSVICYLTIGTLFKIDDLAAAVLAGNGQARFAEGEGFGYFSEYLLGGIIGFT